jgi:protein CpxP
MDIFKQKRYLVYIIILLVILNMSTLLMVWIGRPSHRSANRGPVSPEHEKARVEQLLKDELGFDETQTEQYLMMRQEHHKRVTSLRHEIRQLKKQMFDEVLQDNPQPMLSDSLLRLAQEKQANLEQLTFKHFLDLKKLCKPEQRDKLKLLMHEVFRQKPGSRDDGMPPPHPPEEEQP